MRLLSVKYEQRATFEEAALEADIGYQNNILLSDASNFPYDPSRTSIINAPVFFGHSMAALGIIAINLREDRIRVLDIGGALGGHYAFACTSFNDNLRFEWTVLETPLYVDYAKRMITTPALRFVTDIESIQNEKFDVAYLSSVLPYVKNVRDTLSLSSVRSSKYIFVSRTGLDEEEVPFIQFVTYDVGSVSYAGRILSKSQLEAILSETHELVTSWQNEQYSVGNKVYQAPSMLWRLRS